MKLFYTAYTKEINNVSFYFVKKYIEFPECENSPRVLESMGMHRDFYRACKIASIYDETVIEQLLSQLHIMPKNAKVIPMTGIRSMTHSLIKNTQHAILRFRIAGFN